MPFNKETKLYFKEGNVILISIWSAKSGGFFFPSTSGYSFSSRLFLCISLGLSFISILPFSEICVFRFRSCQYKVNFLFVCVCVWECVIMLRYFTLENYPTVVLTVDLSFCCKWMVSEEFSPSTHRNCWLILLNHKFLNQFRID